MFTQRKSPKYSDLEAPLTSQVNYAAPTPTYTRYKLANCTILLGIAALLILLCFTVGIFSAGNVLSSLSDDSIAPLLSIASNTDDHSAAPITPPLPPLTLPLGQPCPTELNTYTQGRLPDQQLIHTSSPSQQHQHRQTIDCRPQKSDVPTPTPTPTTTPPTQHDDHEIHIQYASDPNEWSAMLASLHSALRNTKSPGRLRFHLTIPAASDETELCRRLLNGLTRHAPAYICPASHVANYARDANPTNNVRSCITRKEEGTGKQSFQHQYQPLPGVSDDTCFCSSPQFHIILFNTSHHDMPTSAAMGGHRNDRASLMNPVNWARNYADEYLLPLGVSKVIYLDSDTIVQDDLCTLWDQHLLAKEGRGVEVEVEGGSGGVDSTNNNNEVVVGFARSCRIKMGSLYNFNNPIVRAAMSPSDCYINAGVYIINLAAYNTSKIRLRIAKLIDIHAKAAIQPGEGSGGSVGGGGSAVALRDKIWTQGVQQPSFVLALLPQAEMIGNGWNTDSLGYNPSKGRLPDCVLRSGSVLHWNGVYKPWKCPAGAGGCYNEYWNLYDITVQRDP
jgi:hypothetical protein